MTTSVNQNATTMFLVPINIIANRRSGLNTIFCRNASWPGVTDITINRPPKFNRIYASPRTYGFMLTSCRFIKIASDWDKFVESFVTSFLTITLTQGNIFT